MRRLGIVWRIALIVIAALVVIQLIAAAAYFVQRERATESGFRLPLPDQIAALVALVEQGGADQRTLALRVANGSGLRVAIRHVAPTEPNPVERVQWLELWLGRAIGHGRTEEGVAQSGMLDATDVAAAVLLACTQSPWRCSRRPLSRRPRRSAHIHSQHRARP